MEGQMKRMGLLNLSLIVLFLVALVSVSNAETLCFQDNFDSVTLDMEKWDKKGDMSGNWHIVYDEVTDRSYLTIDFEADPAFLLANGSYTDKNNLTDDYSLTFRKEYIP